MKAAVVYDSVYGNTKLVAEAIADQLRVEGLQVELHNLREEKVRQVDADVLFLGGPTRMKHLTRKVKGFVKRLDKAYWGSRPIVVFDTFGPIAKTEEERKRQEAWINPGAAGEIQEMAKERGLKTHPTTLRSAVTGLKGPLDPEAVAKAKQFAHDVIASMNK